MMTVPGQGCVAKAWPRHGQGMAKAWPRLLGLRLLRAPRQARRL